MLAITKTNIKTEIEEYKGYVILDFWASWCFPCQVFSPIFEKASKDSKFSDIKFAKLDTDAEGEIASGFGVMSIPTTILFKDGKPIAQQSGAMNESQLNNFILKNKN